MVLTSIAKLINFMIWYLNAIILILLSISCSAQRFQDEIVLVNVEHIGRSGLADLIRKVNRCDPKVIAIDLCFSDRGKDDSQLVFALTEVNNLVMSSLIDSDCLDQNLEFESMLCSLGEFLTNSSTGFTNAVVENNGLNTIKRFAISAMVDGALEYHFAVQIAFEFDSIAAAAFVESHPRIIDVDYKNGLRKYKILSASEIVELGDVSCDTKGKIVMMGFLGPGDADKFFTPLNQSSDKPDKYGVEYLANIVSQVLEYGKK